MSVVFGQGGSAVTITKNPVYPLNWYFKRYNQYAVETADAGFVVYDNGPNLIFGTLIIRNVAKSEGDDLRDYLKDTAVFQQTSFLITPESGGDTNLGKGDGAVIGVYYNGGPDLDGVFTLVSPGYYTITLPYREDKDFSYP